MRIYIIITSLCALAAVAAPGLLYFQAAQAPRAAVSSIIDGPGEVEALHEAVQSELDLMESLLEKAISPAGDRGATERAGQEGLDLTPVVGSDTNWSEIAEYEAVRDERHALHLAAASGPRASVCARPMLPDSSTLTASGRHSVGVVNSTAIATAPRGERQPVIRAQRNQVIGRSAIQAIQVVRMAYHSIRNGYQGGPRALFHATNPACRSHTADPGSRVITPALFLSSSRNFLKATAFARAAYSRADYNPTYTQIGDVV